MQKIKDLIGLNQTTVSALPIVDGLDTAKAAVSMGKAQNQAISILGAGHSQGGHTRLEGGAMCITEAMNGVQYDPATQTVTAEAGATWNNIHHVLKPHGRAVLVQQSSPFFTVGGSLGVNCHGRGALLGPLSSTVVRLQILFKGEVTECVPEDELFKVAVGGYGCCGMILNATFKTCEDLYLERKTTEFANLSAYVDYLDQLEAEAGADIVQYLQYGMLNFSRPAFTLNPFARKEVFMGSLFGVTYTPIPSPPGRRIEYFETQSWGSNDALNIAWSLSRNSRSGKAAAWAALKGFYSPVVQNYRTIWLREGVNFSADLQDHAADMLLEFFVRREDLVAFVAGLRAILEQHKVSVMNATLRTVTQDESTHLSYCAESKMMSLALDFNAKTMLNAEGEKIPVADVYAWVSKAIDCVLAHKGRYYLPYFAFATRAQFDAAYPNASKTRQFIADNDLTALNNNQFVAQYLQ